MKIRPYDAAFSRIWSHDNIWAGLSSFAVEASELSDIFRLSTPNSLVLGDEVCSGTESGSATALVAATLEHLEAKGTHFMFATHLHDLLKVPGLFNGKGISIFHLRVITTPSGKLIYDRSLQPGSGSASYGLEVAKAMGLPLDIITRAHKIRRDLAGEVAIEDAPRSSWNSQIQRQVCEICSSSFVASLEVHHGHERAKGGNNSLRNLTVLCDSCHDKHHNEEITVAPLTQTSEGLERFSYTGSLSVCAASLQESPHLKKIKSAWSEEQLETIRQITNKHTGKPLKRVLMDLQADYSIKMTEQQLKRLLTTLGV
jgi:DNA mismatch repair protein MutS